LKIIYKILARVLKFLVLKVGELNKTFITYHSRPKYAADLDAVGGSSVNNVKLAIVIQGALLLKNDFTLETVKLYKQSFPNAILIVSTWLGEDNDTVKQLRELDCIVIENNKPDYYGLFNINLQIVSSSNGIKRAKELGVEYVIKTRTDQRFYASNIAGFLYNLTELFPVNGECCQKKRIVGVSLNTFKYRMYGLSDMFTYGYIDDMLLYWDSQLDDRKLTDVDFQPNYSLRMFAKWRFAEVYLVTEFLQKIGRKQLWTLKDSWRVFTDHFIIIDQAQLDLFWPKYNRCEFRWRSYSHMGLKGKFKEEMMFKDWFNIYSDLDKIEIYEEILDKIEK
jgi:WavE lipopolysaccharide synthesis